MFKKILLNKSRYIYIYIYLFIYSFNATYLIMYFGRSKCEAVAGHGVILYQFGSSTLLLSDCIGQAKKYRHNSALKGLVWIVFGYRFHNTLYNSKEYDIYIYIYLYLFM